MSERLFRALPYVALVAAAALVVVLGRQKQGLIRDYEELRRQYREALNTPLRGSYVPGFAATTLENSQPVAIAQGSPDERQVLLVYTTTCQFCKASLPAWKRLTATLDTMTQPRVKVYGVTLDSVEVTRRYIAEHRLPYPTVRFPDARVESMYRAGSVPLTVVLDGEGRTLYSRLGEVSRPETVDSIITWVKWKPQPRDSAAAAPASGVPAQSTAAR